MSIFKRLFKISQAEAHAAVNKLEDPIKMTEQGIRDLKLDLDKALEGLAEIKALEIRNRNEAELNKRKAADYEQKAMQLLQQSAKGQLAEAEADRLATEALMKKELHLKHVTQFEGNQQKYQNSADQMEENVRTLKANITTWENELTTLRARVKVSEATKNINKQMAQLDSSGTVSMLERMKDKVAQNEALAQSYGEIANGNKSIDQEIDKALGDAERNKAKEALELLKAKMATEAAENQN